MEYTRLSDEEKFRLNELYLYTIETLCLYGEDYVRANGEKIAKEFSKKWDKMPAEEKKRKFEEFKKRYL